VPSLSQCKTCLIFIFWLLDLCFYCRQDKSPESNLPYPRRQPVRFLMSILAHTFCPPHFAFTTYSFGGTEFASSTSCSPATANCLGYVGRSVLGHDSAACHNLPFYCNIHCCNCQSRRLLRNEATQTFAVSCELCFIRVF
jgi:hypothetical protein